MAKRISVVRAAEGVERDDLVRTLTAKVSDGAEVYVTDPDPRPATAVVIGAIDVPGTILATYDVEEHVPWDDPIGPDVYSMFAFFRPPSGLRHELFLKNYREHADVARVHHPGIRRYVQDIVVSQTGEHRWAMSAISELHFAGRDEYRDRFWLSDESREIVQRDFERFSDPSTAKTIVAPRIA